MRMELGKTGNINSNNVPVWKLNQFLAMLRTYFIGYSSSTNVLGTRAGNFRYCLY